MSSIVTEKLDGKVYPPVGYCIYCRATDQLTNEHILPFGLGGTAILPRSSCKGCAKITGQIEQLLLRGQMWPVRVYRALQSRSKYKDAPRTYPLTIVRDGVDEAVEVPLESYPIFLDFPLYPLPAILNDALYNGYTNGILMCGFRTIHFGADPERVIKLFGGQGLRRTQGQRPVAFARVIAKVAYGFAVANGALDAIEGESFVVPAILGKVDEIGRWVGTSWAHMTRRRLFTMSASVAMRREAFFLRRYDCLLIPRHLRIAWCWVAFERPEGLKGESAA